MNTQTQRRDQRPKIGWLSPAHLRRCPIFKPLAVLLSILLLPAVSWLSGNAGSSAFKASAQIISGCDADPSSTSIIRHFCVTGPSGTIDYHVDLVQLEHDAVTAYLGENGLPVSDAPIVYSLGRSDLRSAVRANMLLNLQAIINEGPAARNAAPHDRNLYNWLSTLVQNNEISDYSAAINEFQTWRSDPCSFTLDPVIASAYNLSYDGRPFCFGVSGILSGPPVPDDSYFKTYGFRKSYAATADQYPYFSSIMAKTSLHVGTIAAIAGVVAWSIAAGVGATIAAATSLGISLGGTVISGISLSAIGSGALLAGPLAIVLVAIAIGVTAGVKAFTDEQNLNELNDMTNTLSQVRSAPPDLLAFSTDTSGVGAYKIQATVLSQTVPEVASAAALPSHQNGVDLNFVIQNGSASTGSSTLNYKDWDGNAASVHTWGGWFVQSCSGPDCSQADSILASFEYVDWSGVKWTVSRSGTNFLSNKATPVSTDKLCKADSNTGVTPGSDFTNCSTYVSASIPLTDANGVKVRVSLSAWASPVFTAPTSLPFAPGIPSSQTISVTGNPTPTVCVSSSNLPAGLSLNGGACGQASFRLSYDGIPVQQGLYHLTLTASGYGTPVSQTFTVLITSQLSITSTNTISVRPGVPFSFLVTTTGLPAPSLSLDPLFPLPAGVTFVDNHNGTATFSGKVGKLDIFACAHAPTVGGSCGVIASNNTQGTVEAPFSINTVLAPQAYVVPPTTATFIAGIPNSVALSWAGAVTPVTSWDISLNANAPWLTAQSNVFDGTLVLSGTPPAGTAGSFTVQVAPFAQFSASFPGLELKTPYTINVINTPVFTTPNTAAFTVGAFGSFNASSNQGSIRVTATPPNGLSLSSGNPATISGTPAAGTGGQYVLRLTDDAGTAGSTTQDLNLNIYEAPSFTSPNNVIFFVGAPSTLAVTTGGFPSVSALPVSNPTPPTNPSQGKGMYFTVAGLPASLHATNLNTAGFATGSLNIKGTPLAADAGTHQVQITAQNGVGAVSQQALTLQIMPYKPTAPVTLLSNWTLTRNSNNDLIATVVLANNGSAVAQNVTLASAKIGTVSGTAVPSKVASISPESTDTFSILFPAASLGAHGSAGVLVLSGTYTGGTFSNAGRIVLP